MRKSYREVNGEKVFRYSIRKYHFGAASVAVAALMFFANGAVKADTLPVSPATANTEKVNVGVTELTEGVPPKENPIEKSKEEVVGDKTPVAQKLVDKSPLVQAISELQAAIAKVDEESLVSLSNQLTKLTDENNRLLNGENTSEEAIASQVSRVQFLTEQVRLLKSKTKDKASNKEDGSGSKAQDKKEVEVSENAVTLVNQTEEIKKSVKDVKVEEVFTNKTKLETLLKEIDKLDPEKYTEDSVKGLKEKVAKAKEVLTIAKNQEEVNSVYKELVNYKNSSLRRVKMTHKPLEENTPKLDTTNGKETVGKKAQNTEPSDRNIAGHNHILNGITLPEGSGLRAAPNNTNFTYETVGADLSSLVAGEELGYGKKVIIKVKYDTKVISTKDVYITTTPNTGPRTEYTRRQQDGIGPYDGGTNIKLVGQIPNDMIGTYDLHIHVLNNKRNNAQMATLNVPITVKPKKPTVRVADLVNAEGKRPVVTATVANTSISKVEFYLNGQKQTEVNATNGQATWTPTSALRENDRITVKNIAQGGIPPIDAYGNTFTTREAMSDMSDAVVIPKAPKPAFDLEAFKNAAKQEITAAANTKKSAIDNNTALTAEEKQTAKNAVDAAATQANRNIDSATNQAGVDTAKNNGKQAINAVPVNGTAKAAAKQEITAAANTKKSAIDGQAGLTSEEKQTAKNAVDAAATQANRNIDSATNQAGVDTAKNNGKQAINAVPVNGTAKAAAKQEITAAANTKKSAIDGQAGLTSEEKQTAKNAVDTEATKAKAAIDKATDQAGVNSAKAAGKQAIENVPTTATSKDAAKQEITNAAEAKKTAIDNNTALTAEEKQTAKNAVDAAATQANRNIDSATNQAGVDTAKNNGKQAINAVPVNGTAKAAAKQEITAAANTKKSAIDGQAGLTSEEKQTAKNAVDTEATKAKAAIDKATDQAGVNSAKAAGKQAIENVPTTATSKDAAKQEITNAAEAKKTAIDGQAGLTSEEKQTAKNAVDTEATKAKAAIDKATDQAGVDKAKNDGLTAIEAVNPVGKEKALEAIQTASEAKIASIDKNAKLSDDEKATAKAEVAKAAIAAVNAINEAKDQAGVDSAQTTGVKAIEAVNPVGKEKALEAIQTASEAKIASIDKNAKLSDDEKATAKAEVAKAAIAAVNAINEAKDQAGVDSAQTTGVKAIEAVNPVGKGSTNNEGHVITPPTVEVPAYIGSVNGISEETPAKPDYDGSANEMPERTPISETAINKDRQLPKTGTADSTAAMVAAAASAVLGLALAGRRRKEDEEV